MTDKPFDRVWKNSERLLQEILDQAEGHHADGAFESPIEEAFALAANALRLVLYREIDWRPDPNMTIDDLRNTAALPGDEGIPQYMWSSGFGCMAPQVKIDNYRADFMILHRKGIFGVSAVVIECDGHEFHERTKEQAARDKARDRELQSRGFKVFRFTGSEIWADPLGCADTALQAAFDVAQNSENARLMYERGDVAGAMSELRYINQH